MMMASEEHNKRLLSKRLKRKRETLPDGPGYEMDGWGRPWWPRPPVPLPLPSPSEWPVSLATHLENFASFKTQLLAHLQKWESLPIGILETVVKRVLQIHFPSPLCAIIAAYWGETFTCLQCKRDDFVWKECAVCYNCAMAMIASQEYLMFQCGRIIVANAWSVPVAAARGEA